MRECAYYGALNVSVDGVSRTTNTDSVVVPARSTLKAWQLAACLPYLGAPDNWAIGMASSSGESIHREAINALATSFSVDPEADLKCPRCYSYATNEAARQIANGTAKTRLNHFCCGKHLAHFIAAQNTGTSDYLSRETAQHRALCAMVQEMAGDSGHWITDSCGLPCWAAPMISHARLWNTLSSTDNASVQSAMALWTSHPLLIGGSERVDTKLLEFGAGRLLAKEGADGLLFVHALGTQAEPSVTILIKMAQTARDAQLFFALCAAIETHVPKQAQLLHALREELSNDLHVEFQAFENVLN